MTVQGLVGSVLGSIWENIWRSIWLGVVLFLASPPLAFSAHQEFRGSPQGSQRSHQAKRARVSSAIAQAVEKDVQAACGIGATAQAMPTDPSAIAGLAAAASTFEPVVIPNAQREQSLDGKETYTFPEGGPGPLILGKQLGNGDV